MVAATKTAGNLENVPLKSSRQHSTQDTRARTWRTSKSRGVTRSSPKPFSAELSNADELPGRLVKVAISPLSAGLPKSACWKLSGDKPSIWYALQWLAGRPDLSARYEELASSISAHSAALGVSGSDPLFRSLVAGSRPFIYRLPVAAICIIDGVEQTFEYGTS